MVTEIEVHYVVCGGKNLYFPRCKTFSCRRWNAKKEKDDIYPLEVVEIRAFAWLEKRNLAGTVYRVSWGTDRQGVIYDYLGGTTKQ